MSEPTEGYVVRAIGRVVSPFATPADVPPGGAPAEIEVGAEYEAALDDIERGSHLVVVGFLHLADRTVLQARRRKWDPEGPPSGVFACRSPARPNPLSLTVVRLVAREGRRLRVDPLDLADGTPVVDLKPYCPGWDGVFSARREPRGLSSALAERLEGLLERDLLNHLGDDAARPEAREVLAAVLAASRAFGVEPRDPRVRAFVNRADVRADALMGLLGATLSGGRLRVEPDDRPPTVRLEFEGRSFDPATSARPA